MQKMLEKLYRGEIFPEEQMKIKVKEHNEISDKIDKAIESISKNLGKEQEEKLDDLVSLTYIVSSNANLQFFIDGFKMGAQIIMEVCDKDK